MRAGLYYLLAERMPSHKDPRRMIAYKRGIALYEKGLKLRKEPVEIVEIPYGGHKLKAYFMKAPVLRASPARGRAALHGALRRLRRDQGDHLRRAVRRNTAGAASRC